MNRFLRSIKNLFVWFKVIWNDRQYDYYFFFIILHKKLEEMERFFDSDEALWVYAQKEAKQIRTLKLLAKRIIDDKYHENVFAPHDKKWGDLNFSIKQGVFNSFRPNVITEQDKNKERKEAKRLFEKERYMINQDINYLFKKLSKKITSWWD